MTLRHFAYELPPGILNRLPKPAPGHGAFPERLRKCTVAVISRSNPAVEEFLVAVRYDPSWLNDAPDAPSRLAHWTLLCLAAGLRTTTSLGREPPLHHLTLAVACPALGWSREEIQLLLHGQPLGDYLRQLGLDYGCMEHLNDIAGCLNADQRKALLAKLRTSLGAQDSADSSLTDSLERALFPLFFGSPKIAGPAEARAAIEAAVAMLSSVSSPQHHLLLIVD